jgi:hypothetical protein
MTKKKDNKTTLLGVVSPVSVYIPRKTKKDKVVYLNMNTYRNLHYIVSNQAKKAYLDIIKEQVEGVEMQIPIEVEYRVYKGSKRRLDKMNVVSIVSKFFFDALVTIGCLPDDSDEFIKKEVIMPTIYDKGNPRVEITLKSVYE